MAHPGHGAELGLAAGLAHPWSGIDHVLAMTAVGLLAARLGGRALWAVPAAFLSLMALGGIVTASGLSLPFAEVAIALSVAVFGFTIASRIAPPVLAAMALDGFPGVDRATARARHRHRAGHRQRRCGAAAACGSHLRFRDRPSRHRTGARRHLELCCEATPSFGRLCPAITMH
jgi:hypothetical protein